MMYTLYGLFAGYPYRQLSRVSLYQTTMAPLTSISMSHCRRSVRRTHCGTNSGISRKTTCMTTSVRLSSWNVRPTRAIHY